MVTSCEIFNHILLSQIRDFPFCRLLGLAGLRWRYSTQPPHGIQCSNSQFVPLITSRHGPRREHRSSVAVSSCCVHVCWRRQLLYPIVAVECFVCLSRDHLATCHNIFSVFIIKCIFEPVDINCIYGTHVDIVAVLRRCHEGEVPVWRWGRIPPPWSCES
jgi:hypothetical protein